MMTQRTSKRTNWLVFVKSSHMSQVILELSNYASYYAYVVCQDPKLDTERARLAEILAAKTEEEIRALKPDDPEVAVNGKILRLTIQNLSILDKAVETYLGGTFKVPRKRQVDREDCDGYNVFVNRQFSQLGAQTVFERLFAFVALGSQQEQTTSHSLLAKMTELQHAAISWMERLHEARKLFSADRARHSAAITMRAFNHITNFQYDQARHHILTWIRYIIDMTNSLVLLSKSIGNDSTYPINNRFWFDKA